MSNSLRVLSIFAGCVIAVLGCVAPVWATSIIGIDAAFTSHGTSATDPFSGTPDFLLDGQFTLNERLNTGPLFGPVISGPITAWDLTFTDVATGSMFHTTGQDPANGFGTATSAFNGALEFWQFSLQDPGFSFALITIFRTGGPLSEREFLPLCAIQNTWYPDGRALLSDACSTTSVAAFGEHFGFIYSVPFPGGSIGGLPSGNISVISADPVPESSDLLLSLVGATCCFGLCTASKLKRRNRAGRSTPSGQAGTPVSIKR